MSCNLINKIPGAVGVQPDFSRRSANTPLYAGAANGVGGGEKLAPVPRVQSLVGEEEKSAQLNAMLSMFRSFIQQLLQMVGDKKDKEGRDVAPSPTDKVIPDPFLPKPKPDLPIPGLSTKRDGAKPDNIWSGFRQGPDGNCVTVSAIKAAMVRFGQSPTDIFKEVAKTQSGYTVTMRDNVEVKLTEAELKQAAAGSRFVGLDKGMLKDAQFLYAVSAKRAQMENNDRTAAGSFRAAINSLNDGEDERGAGEGFLRLGLKHHMKKVHVSELARGEIGMVNRAQHSVAVINGREELWGTVGGRPLRGDAVALK